MNSKLPTRRVLLGSAVLLIISLTIGFAPGCGPSPQAAAEVNPCAAKTLNPCDAKQAKAGNPCGGASVDAAKFVQGTRKLASSGSAKQGEKLWTDRQLGKSGLACSSCHIDRYTLMNPTFKQSYPHRVAMPHDQGGVDKVNAAEMVQFCMLVPMATDPLPWDSDKLASLSAYVESIQSGYKPIAGGGANPCNPCGGR